MKLTKRIEEFSNIIKLVSFTDTNSEIFDLERGMELILNLLLSCKKKKGITYVIGNGGSAAIASHAVIDLLNMGSLRALTLHDTSVITCISNDYGYEQVYEKQIKQLVTNQDLLIAISSSGQSKNILNAVKAAKTNRAKIITLSGFLSENPLRRLGDVNIWLNSTDYGFVEIGHAFVLHNITDRLCVIRNQLKVNELCISD